MPGRTVADPVWPEQRQDTQPGDGSALYGLALTCIQRRGEGVAVDARIPNVEGEETEDQ